MHLCLSGLITFGSGEIVARRSSLRRRNAGRSGMGLIQGSKERLRERIPHTKRRVERGGVSNSRFCIVTRTGAAGIGNIRRRMAARRTGSCVVFLIALWFPATAALAGDDAAVSLARGGESSAFQHTLLLHLPGVAGELSIDRDLIRGLRAGGFGGEAEIYDWTESDPGLSALWSRQRNDQEAQRIAHKIIQIVKDDPAVRITITAHSGGAGLAVWALEKLPDDVQVQTLLLLSSALSPGYDLTKALRHVRQNAYAFNSDYDAIVLGAGTRAFGTIDGVRTEASGKVGFVMPRDGDPLQYAKLVQFPFDRAWMKYGNLGDHIGMLKPEFARRVLAPLVLAGLVVSTTQPATRPGH